MKLLSCVWLFVTPWIVAYQAAPSMGFSRQEYWSGLPFPSSGDLPDPGIEHRSPSLQADSLPLCLQWWTSYYSAPLCGYKATITAGFWCMKWELEKLKSWGFYQTAGWTFSTGAIIHALVKDLQENRIYTENVYVFSSSDSLFMFIQSPSFPPFLLFFFPPPSFHLSQISHICI